MPFRLLPPGPAALAAAALLGAAPAAALPPVDARFDVEVAGLRLGSVALRNVREGAAYAAAARIEAAGLAALFGAVRIEASVEGRVAAGRPVPARFRDAVATPRRRGRTEMIYDRGVPREVRLDPVPAPAPWQLDPRAQGGTLDPVTAAVLLLADVAPERACRLDLALFDGRRRSRLLLAPAAAGGEPGRVVCAGEFRRIAGYPPEDLAEARAFRFRMAYAPGPDGRLRVAEIETTSPFGRGRLVRR